jgi:hypothetical protein
MESHKRFYISHDDPTVAEAIDLSHRINRWRLEVEAASPSLQWALPCDNVPSFSTRPRNLRLRKPYARPPDSPRHQKSLGQVEVSDLQIDESAVFLDGHQVSGAPEVTKDGCEMRGYAPSITNLDLPHPQRNPLVCSLFFLSVL